MFFKFILLSIFRPVLDYGTPGKRESAMFAKFNQLGTQILALMRRTGPVIYNIHEKSAVVEFSHTDYSNVCTMKNPCFAGDRDQVQMHFLRGLTGEV